MQTEPKPTPMEERAARTVHNAAFDAAKARGADFHCASEAGFAATDKPPRAPKFCEVCVKRGVGR